MGASNLHRLLQHPYYMGMIRYQGKVYAGRHEPLVSEQTWSQVQAVMRAQNYAGEKRRKHPHYLVGSVFCGQCGSRLIVTHAKGRRGGIYPYFICGGRHNRRTDCTFRAVLIERVEELVEDEYAKVEADLKDEWIKKLRDVLAVDVETFRTHAEFEFKEQSQRIDRLNGQRKKLLQAHYADAIPFELFKEEQVRISMEITDAEGRLSAITKAPAESLEHMLDALVGLVRSSHRSYLASEPLVRRLFNQAFFERLDVDQEGKELAKVKLADPLDLIVRPETTGLLDEVEACIGGGNSNTSLGVTTPGGGLNMTLMVVLRGRLSNPSAQVRKLLERLDGAEPAPSSPPKPTHAPVLKYQAQASGRGG